MKAADCRPPLTDTCLNADLVVMLDYRPVADCRPPVKHACLIAGIVNIADHRPNVSCSFLTADPEAKGGYFDYSIDELGLQDMKAADEVINSLALKELGYAQCVLLIYSLICTPHFYVVSAALSF